MKSILIIGVGFIGLGILILGAAIALLVLGLMEAKKKVEICPKCQNSLTDFTYCHNCQQKMAYNPVKKWIFLGISIGLFVLIFIILLVLIMSFILNGFVF